ncbi:MAG: hypothetical protein OHK0012_11580 [Synechococcales cyanobacterium]
MAITLYRFPYSCYALKVQYLLAYLGLEHSVVDVPYGDRSQLVALTGGRVVVPALDHDGTVVTESRTICHYLLGLTSHTLVPPALAALIWAYGDWCDTVLEDVLFRLASPGIARRFPTAAESALFVFIKERKFGSGCVDLWQQQQDHLLATAQGLLQPTLGSLSAQPFVAGATVTLADIGLAAHLAMVEYADPALVTALNPRWPDYLARVRTLV